MKNILLIGVALAAAAIGATRAFTQTEQPPVSGPWQVTRCYRVFLAIDEAPHVLKIHDSAGDWVRVSAEPASPRVPGMRPSDPMWLNTRLVQAVQEWNCAAVR